MDKKNKRQKFLWVLGLLLTVAISLGLFTPNLQQKFESAKAAAEQYLPLEKDDVRAIRQVITADSSNSRTIMWQSPAEDKNAIIEYRKKNDSASQAIPVLSKKFTDDGETVYLYTVKLENLASGTQYEYRIGNGEKRSVWYNLNTDNGESFKALIFADSQSNDYSSWKSIAQFARKENPDAAFFMNIGDLVDNGEDRSQWKAWFNGVEGIIENIPAAPVMGNHETYNRDWKVRMPEAYLNLFLLPGNGNESFKNQFYSYDYGPVHFVVLNTQTDEMSQFQPDLLAAQQEWFINDMKNTNKKWKVVLMHKDVLTYEIKNRTDRTAGISSFGQAWMPLFDQYNIDVVLSAHLHTYRRRANIYNFEPDTRGPVYIITGVTGNVRYPGLWIDHPFDRSVAPQPETDNYMTLEASANRLRLASFLADGKQIDQIEITK